MIVKQTLSTLNNNRNWNRAAVLIFGITLVVAAMPVEAGLPSGCLIDESGVSGCTAGDMGINDIKVTVVSDGCISLSDTATVNIELQLNAANPTRYDVGLFLALDGGDAVATGGSCFHEALFPLKTPQGTVPTDVDRATGIGPFLDSDGDSCGEVQNSNIYQRLLVAGDVSTGSTTAAELVIACEDIIDENGAAIPNGYLDLGWVVSWVQNAGGVICTSVADAVPGTSSKCQSGRTDSYSSTGIPIGIPTLPLTLTLNCTPDLLGPGDTVECTMTYSNPNTIGPGDHIEYRIDFPESLGTVSNFGPDATDSANSTNGPADSNGGTDTDYIQVVPGGAPSDTVPGLSNIAPGDSGSFTFDFTVADTAPDGPFTITAYTWYNNGTNTSYQNQSASDTTQVTPAVISDFTTHRHRGQTLVQWETAAETGTAGFYLEREDAASGQWTRVNEGLLPALLERPGGGTYAFLDSTAKPFDSQTYRLVAVDFTGEREIHGPYNRRTEGLGRFENFDAMQSKGFARLPHRPSTASVAAWDAKRQARNDEVSLVKASKGLAPSSAASMKARMHLNGEGLFTLSATTLADQFGMDERKVRKAVKQGNLELNHGGSPVAYLPSDNFDRVFFFGQEIDSRFTDENTYWASFEKRPGAQSVNLMDEIGGIVPAAVGTPQSFPSVAAFEEDVWLVPYAVSDPEADIWFGGFISTGYYGEMTYVTTLHAPDASDGGQAELRLQLYGLTNLTAGNDHHAEVRINGALIGEGSWDGVTPMTVVGNFDQSILNDGDNILEVNGVLDGAVEQSSFVVDTVDLTYDRHYNAVNDALIFGTNGYRVITVRGFTGPDIEVFDLQSPAQPLRLTGTNIEASGNGYRVTFAPASNEGSYLAVRRAAAGDPSGFEIDRPSTLRSTNNAGEYIVIAPASLHGGAQALVDYRQQRFSTARLIDTQDIYDEFNAGVEDPSAISSFLKYALTSWEISPRFVVLAGKGTLDPKDIKGFGTNVLPLVMSSTPYGLFASDSRLADVLGSDGVPDVAVGRIPVLSSAELEGYVQKLRTHEFSTRTPGPLYALMLADNSDTGGDFPGDSLNVAAILPDDVFPIHIAHQTGSDPAETRQLLLDVINQGVGYFNFIGHGAPTQLGTEAFWAMPDIPSMINGDQFPIFGAFTCYAGNGTYPGVSSLTEEMTLLANGGIVAALAPTGLSINNRAVLLNRAFVRALIDGGMTIGEATQKAVETLRNQGGPQFIQEIYNVVGDPAVKINE